MKKLIAFFKDEEGATAVEYAVMVSLVAAAIILTVTAMGTSVTATFQGVVDAL